MSEAGAVFHHRSALKQKNRPFKGKSKGRFKKLNKGKVDVDADAAPRTSARTASADTVHRKADRLHKAKQIQKLKRTDLLAKLRIGSRLGPPKVIAIVALSPSADVQVLAQQLVAYCNGTADSAHSAHKLAPPEQHHPAMVTVTALVDKKPSKFTLLLAERSPFGVLDAAKVADVMLFVATPEADQKEGVALDALGSHFLSIVKAQGLPAHIGVFQGMSTVPPKHHHAMKRYATEFFHQAFDADTRSVVVDSPADCAPLLRWMGSLRLRDIQWREMRSYLVAEAASFEPDASSGGVTGTLRLRGYLRGKRPLCANQLVHITGHGDYQLKQIDAAGPSVPSASSDPGTSHVLQVADPSKQESLESILPLSALATTANDQSIITDDEIKDARAQTSADKRARRVTNSLAPSVWDELVPEEDEDEDEAASDAESKQSGADVEMASVTDTNGVADGDDDDFDATGMDEDDTGDLSREELQWARMTPLERRRKLEAEQAEFPDELDTPMDELAKQRFAKYRGLKSLRHSSWDKFESLPVEYSQIYTFQRFSQTRKRVTALPSLARVGPVSKPKKQANGHGSMDIDMTAAAAGSDAMLVGGGAADADSDHLGMSAPVDETGVQPGTCVVLHLANVSREVGLALCTPSPRPICVWGLLEYEHKVSVMHFLVRRSPDDADLPVKGKDPMLFSVGFRRFVSRPVYSQNTNGDKHLVERFLYKDRWTVASTYARIMFPPAPVLMFRGDGAPGFALAGHEEEAQQVLSQWPFNPVVAYGSLMAVDPHRLLVKRIILTGEPAQSHKRSALVRKMFFNPDDVRWFKPIELRTKKGLTGHIREPHGLKGHMKCSFDAYIKQDDVVCMSLYKRQFPPWSSELFGQH